MLMTFKIIDFSTFVPNFVHVHSSMTEKMKKGPKLVFGPLDPQFLSDHHQNLYSTGD